MGEHVQPGPHQCLREVLARRVDSVPGTARDSPDDFLCHVYHYAPVGRLVLEFDARDQKRLLPVGMD